MLLTSQGTLEACLCLNLVVQLFKGAAARIDANLLAQSTTNDRHPTPSMRPLTVRGIISFAVMAAVTHALPGIMPQKRDLPVDHGCDPCPGGDTSYYDMAQQYYAQINPQYLQDGQDSFGQSFPIGYVPPLCGVYGVNCVT